ncbi:hypothetical protein G9A89_008508 [Geosiphon pyriformis]|nr:hypothetical protein G9A89_008508 [Geosiphon pyriformis]
MKTLVHIIFGQLITHPQFRKNLHKFLILKKKSLKTNKHSCQARLTNNSNVTLLICKAQVAGYFIDLILNSESSVSVIAKHFFEAIGRKIDEFLTKPMTNIHTKAVSVCINGVTGWSNKLMDSKREQDCRVMKIIKEDSTSISELNEYGFNPPDFKYLNHQIHIWIAAYQLAETLFETKEESYQTASVFDFFLSKSEHSTQTVTPEPMANDSMQTNILATLQDIQTALGRRNNTPLPLFRSDAQDPIK